MHKRFFQLGIWSYRYRYLIIFIWLLGLIASLPIIPHLMEPFQSSGFENIHSQSQAAQRVLAKKMNYQNHRFLILYQKKSLDVSTALMKKEIQQSLQPLKDYPHAHQIFWERKKNATLIVIAFKDDMNLLDKDIENLESFIKKPKHLKIYFGGDDVFVETVNKQTEKDLFRADMVATPLSIVTLLFVFGSLAAAIIPIFLGACCAIMMFAMLFHLAHHFDLSIFTINIALLLGLCLSLDYALFIICRFREELQNNSKNIQEVIAETMATAGKAVFFSGLAVFASLSALLLFPINILISVGIGGLTAVFLAVIGAMTLLPAILSVIQKKIDFGLIFQAGFKQNRFWHRLASIVISRPLVFVILGSTILIILSLPLQNLKLGISDYHILPEKSAGREFFQRYSNVFDEHRLAPITIVMESTSSMLSAKNIKAAYQLAQKIKKNQSVKSVEGYLSVLPNGNLKAYQQLYAMKKNQLPETITELLNSSVHGHYSVFQVISRYSSESIETQQLVNALRELKQPGLKILIGGVPAINTDVFEGIKTETPKALRLIMFVTFIVLMLLLQSLFLPFKAILMNLLSLSATYGILVYVFQEGHLHQFFNFEPQGSLDISMMVIIFCALFGFSMDYEVFLLSRIQESYQRHQNNKMSIVYGIEHSARIITSAAMIVIALCSSFLVADVLMVKAFGLGIAVAIFIDAFIIRTFLVPAIMTITASINWYYPRWLKKRLND